MPFFRAFGTVSLMTFISRILGFVRDLLAAYFFGASLLYDAFLTAFTAPNLLRRLFGEGALNAAVVPVFAEYEKDETESRRFVASLTGWFLLVVGGLVLAVLIAVFVLLQFPLSEKWSLTLGMFWRMFPYAFLICLVAMFAALLNVKGRFFAPATAPILLNLFWISTLLLLGFHLRLLERDVAFSLCFIIVAAGLAQVLLQVVSARRAGIGQGVSFKPHRGVRRVRALMLPMLFGLALYQVNILADRLIVLAFVEKEGGVTALFYANRLVQFPLALVGISAATALFPALAKAAHNGVSDRLTTLIRRSTNTVVILALPASAGLILLRNDIVSVLFRRGRFTEEASARTADVLLFYASALLFFCLVHIITRLFYARGRIRPVVVVTALCTLINLFLNIALVFYIAEKGVALATAVSSALNFLMLLAVVGKSERKGFVEGFRTLLPVFLCSAVMVAGLLLINYAFEFSAVRLIVSVAVGVLLYFGSAVLLMRGRLRDIMAKE